MRKPRVMLRISQIRKHNAFLLKLIEITQNRELCALYQSGLIETDLTGRAVLKRQS